MATKRKWYETKNGLYWQWCEHSKPLIGFNLRIPFTDGDWSFNGYMRFRPPSYKHPLDSWFVIDWPWIRYSGWTDEHGKRVRKQDCAWYQLEQNA